MTWFSSKQWDLVVYELTLVVNISIITATINTVDHQGVDHSFACSFVPFFFLTPFAITHL